VTLHEVDQAVEQAITALRRLPYGRLSREQPLAARASPGARAAGEACELCTATGALDVHHHRTYEGLGFERRRT
jgi:hypothetical protein